MNGQKAEARVWVSLMFGEDRQYAGNTGYNDDPDRWYSYDSYVPNHLRVAPGHHLILCDKVKALGIAQIEKIESKPDIRLLQRCPLCGDTGIKTRKTKLPKYRCNNKHEFEEPVRENASCTLYTAHFGRTLTRFSETFGRDFLRQGCPRYNDQLAIQAFDFFRMESEFRNRFPDSAKRIRDLISQSYISAEAANPEPADGPAESGYLPGDEDERGQLLRQIRARRGQQRFRDNLRARYGDQCMISGCTVLHVLEAAHIRPYCGHADNHVENGLILRSDLHTLFDLDLLGIEPSTLTIHLHPDIIRSEYRQFAGAKLAGIADQGPSPRVLALRWQSFIHRASQFAEVTAINFHP